MGKPLKKCTALLISFLMALTLLPAVAWAADAVDWSGVMAAVASETVASETNITLTASTTIQAGTYDLRGKTVTFNGTATISGNVTITGGKILRGTSNTGALFSVNGSGSSLTLSNITVDGQKSTVTASNSLVDISSGGTVTLGEGAVLTNNKSDGSGRGSAVTVDGGTLRINGGSIKDNETTAYSNNGNGGTIKTYYGATVTMTGGEISGNSGARHGGAIQLYGAQESNTSQTSLVTFTMSGGTISNNSLGYSSGVGGGVAISNTATFIMTGGTITGNSCGFSGRGGGVAFTDGDNTSMEISGSAVIDGNKKGSSENNLEIGTNDNNRLNVAGALSGANIGVTRTNNSTNVFTTSGSEITPANYIDQFSSDNTSYYVDKDGNGQLLLKQISTTISFDTNLTENGTANPGDTLSISASAGSATPTYQWYSCTDENKSGAQPIDSANGERFTVPDNLAVGNHYYFCRVSAEGAAPVDSNVVKVTVEEPAVIEATWGQSSSDLTNSGTLKQAFAASPAYIQLQTNVTLGTGIAVSGGTITLDLNGKTITGAAGIDANSPHGVTPITVGGDTLTLIDSAGGGGITGGSAAAASTSTAGYGLKVENGALYIGDGTSTGGFTLTGGDASGNNGIAGTGLYIATGGTVTVNQSISVVAGKRENKYNNAIVSYGTFYGNNKAITATGEISIAGGSATDLNATVTDATDALLIGNNVTSVTITGGSYTGERYGLWLNGTPANVVTISGGTFVGNTSDNKQAIHVNSNNTYAGILADGCAYTNSESNEAITDEDTLAAATKLAVRSGGSSTEYSISVSVEGTGGTASASVSTAAAGTEITLTATPDTGYAFKGWQVDYPVGLTITENKFTMPAGNVEIKAVFETESSGTPPTVTTATLPNGRVEEEYSQKLSATGDTPISWDIESGSLPAGLSLDSSKSVISGRPTAAGTFAFTVKAANSAGSDTKALSITINEKSTAVISVSASPADSGVVSGGGEWMKDSPVVVTATAKDGYRFVKWTENGNEVSTDAVYSFTATADRTLVAVFEREPVNPPIYTAPSITAQPQNKSIKVGETATFTVAATGTPEPTYQWQIDRGDGSGWVDISGATQASYTTGVVSLDNSGYKYRCVITNSAGSVTSGEVLLTAAGDSGEEIIVEPRINEDFDDSDIPQALRGEGLDTVEEIDAALKTEIERKDNDIENTELYDVVLMYSTDGGATWTKADESHFPASGELPVQLPVPDGTDPAAHEYIVAHMFTSDAFDKTPGDVEYPDVTEREINGEWYLEFYVTGLSPISIGWKTTGTTPVTTYTVTYTDGVGGAAFANQVYDNLTAGTSTPAFNGTPIRDGFTFTGWNPSIAATVTADATYTAQWNENSQPPAVTYTVTYTDGVGGTVFSNDVHTVYAGNATPAFRGGTPTRDGFTFTGWNPSIAATVTADATYTAQWQEDNAPIVPDPENPPVITSPTKDQKTSVYVGNKAAMSIKATGATSYQWYVDRGNGFEAISGATGASYTTSAASLENDGYQYYCVAINAYGTDTSPIFTLKVLKDTGVPATGDNSHIGLWIGLMMIALAGLITCAVMWRRRKQA